MPPDAPDNAIDVLACADWENLMPKLLQAAAGCLRALGWAEDEEHLPFMLEARELVNDAVASCLEGERRLTPAARESDEGLVAFLCVTMRSIAVNRRTSAGFARRAGADALDQQADDAPSPSREVAARALLRQIERALEGDEEALAVHRATADGHTEREEIAAALGWTPQRVKAVRLRMSRRLARAHVSLDDDGTIAEPPSSGP